MNSRTYLAGAVALIAIAAGGVLLYGRYVRVPENVAYVSEEPGWISVIDLNTMKVVNRIHPDDTEPRGLSLTFDGKYLVTANKSTSDASVFDTRGLSLVRRIQVGDNPEFVKLEPGGKSVFTSFEPGSSGAPPKEGPSGQEIEDDSGPPSQVVAFSVQDWARERSFVAGQETEGIEFSADGKILIVANEAQNTMGIYDVESGKRLREIDLATIGIRPRGVKRSPQGNMYAITMEASGTLLTLDQNFNVIRSVATGAKPYGVSFDRAGRRIFVAAATARKLQVFAADTLQLLAEIPIGQRCWHFTFTPDDAKILMVCGRSNNVYVIDAKSYAVLSTIEGFQLPWGIATYPRAYGSLDLP